MGPFAPGPAGRSLPLALGWPRAQVGSSPRGCLVPAFGVRGHPRQGRCWRREATRGCPWGHRAQGCGSAGQGGAGAELSAGCGWGSVRSPPSSAAAGGGDPGASMGWQGRSRAPGLPHGRGDRGSSVPSPRRGRQRGPAAGASNSSWPPAGSPLPPSHDWSGGAALPHADMGQPGQFAVPAARSAFCLLPRPSPALPGSARCHPRRGWWHGDGRATRLISCLLQAKRCPELPSCCPSRPLPPPNAASRSRRCEER